METLRRYSRVINYNSYTSLNGMNTSHLKVSLRLYSLERCHGMIQLR
nr:MAG TPA: hypothetical protein [Crassvirales sp.]